MDDRLYKLSPDPISGINRYQKKSINTYISLRDFKSLMSMSLISSQYAGA